AVSWPLDRADRPRHGRGEVAPGRGDDAGGEGRGVEPVLGADDEVGVERPRRAWLRLRARELVEEALNEVQARIRVDRVVPRAQPRERGERGRRERGQGARLLRR